MVILCNICQIILHFLRRGEVIIDPGVSLEGVLSEAKYFGVQSMVSRLSTHLPMMVLDTQTGPTCRTVGVPGPGAHLLWCSSYNSIADGCELSLSMGLATSAISFREYRNSISRGAST